MIQECMECNGAGMITEIKGLIGGEHYTEILDQCLQYNIPGLDISLEDAIFQEGNDAKNTFKGAQIQIFTYKTYVMDISTQSSDISSTSYLWDQQ